MRRHWTSIVIISALSTTACEEKTLAPPSHGKFVLSCSYPDGGNGAYLMEIDADGDWLGFEPICEGACEIENRPDRLVVRRDGSTWSVNKVSGEIQTNIVFRGSAWPMDGTCVIDNSFIERMK